MSKLKNAANIQFFGIVCDFFCIFADVFWKNEEKMIKESYKCFICSLA